MSKQTDALGRLRDLTDEEMKGALMRAKNELFKMRMANHTKQLENPLALRAKRREVAKMHTIMTGRTKGLEKQGQQNA